MTFPKIIDTASSFTMARHICPRPPRIRQTTGDAGPFTAHAARAPREVIQHAIDLLDPAHTMRLTELINAPTILQVPRYYFCGARGVEELCLILAAPGSSSESVFAVAVCSDDTVRLGHVCLPAGSWNEVRAQAHSLCETEVDALQEVMWTHGGQLVDSLSACADVTLMRCGNKPAQQRSMATLDEALSESWLHAGDVWCDTIDANDLDLLKLNGISPATLRSALRDRMGERCARVMNHLDYFETGVANDPILCRWRQFLLTSPDTDFAPCLTAYNYLVSREPVVSATRVAVWNDPAFVARVRDFARYQRSSEALHLSAQRRL